MRIALVTLLFALPALAQSSDARCAALEQEVARLRADMTKLQAEVAQLKAGRPSAPTVANRPDPAAVYAIPIEGAPMRGAQDAWVTIVEVSDFQCPFCGRAERTMRELLDTYGGDVRLVYLHNALPFHTYARPAAIAATCAQRQQKFWPMHDALFDNQRALTDADLKSYAASIPGLDLGRWRRCLTDKGVASQVDEQAQLAQRFGARGTPSFFINGRTITGAQPAENFKRLIDAELAKAKASGIPRAYYYQKAVLEEGKPSAP